jgi:acetyltransferase-like isoleucine patch superfamily enzyme
MKGKIVIADHCELEQGVVLDAFGGSIELSERVFVGPYCVLYGHGGITVGENTMIAMQCSLVASNHTVAPQDTIIRDHPDERDPIQIGKDVWIGAGVRVLAGVTIADGCIVGAGSVVTDDLPPYSIAVGVPARVVKQRPSS